MLWFLKYFHRKNYPKNWRFWLKTKLNFEKKLIVTLVFKKNANFFAENWEKSQKIVIINNIDPWSQSYKLELQTRRRKQFLHNG
jgi:hypothetical protein